MKVTDFVIVTVVVAVTVMLTLNVPSMPPGVLGTKNTAPLVLTLRGPGPSFNKGFQISTEEFSVPLTIQLIIQTIEVYCGLVYKSKPT